MFRSVWKFECCHFISYFIVVAFKFFEVNLMSIAHFYGKLAHKKSKNAMRFTILPKTPPFKDDMIEMYVWKRVCIANANSTILFFIPFKNVYFAKKSIFFLCEFDDCCLIYIICTLGAMLPYTFVATPMRAIQISQNKYLHFILNIFIAVRARKNRWWQRLCKCGFILLLLLLFFLFRRCWIFKKKTVVVEFGKGN